MTEGQVNSQKNDRKLDSSKGNGTIRYPVASCLRLLKVWKLGMLFYVLYLIFCLSLWLKSLVKTIMPIDVWGFFFFSLLTLLWHMDLWPGIKSEPQLQPKPQLQNTRSLNHRAGPGIKPVSHAFQDTANLIASQQELLSFVLFFNEKVVLWKNRLI